MNSTLAAYQYYTSLEPRISERVKELDQLIKEKGENLEGNCFYHGNTYISDWFFVYKRMNFANIIKEFNIKRMIEIGFNGGHSALVFLEAMGQDAQYTCFDLGDHLYSRPCFDFLKSNYPQVKEYIEGDSQKTLSEFLMVNPEYYKSCDCIHVDGGHSDHIVKSDIMWANAYLKLGGILILDDTQLKCIELMIPQLLNNGYILLYQIPTFGFSHTCLQKVRDS